MKVIAFLKNFWLDFFAAFYKRLKKNAAYETPISIVLHVSFTQAVNFNTLLVIFWYLFFSSIRLNFFILFSPVVVMGLINSYYFYRKLDEKQRVFILNRKPKYKTIVYDLYDVFSTVLFILVLYLASKR